MNASLLAGPSGESVAITFDDGPDPRWTARVLDELERLGAPASFFLMSSRALAYPRLVERMVGDGHTIGLHCREHLRHSDCHRARIELDTTRALRELDALGLQPTLWRTPWGRTAGWTAAVADRNGLTLVGWTLEPRDWSGLAAERMLAAVEPGLQPGAVILLHDGIGPGARRAGCVETVRLLEPLLAAVSERGLQPVRLAAGGDYGRGAG